MINKLELIEKICKAIKEMRTSHDNGTYYWYLGQDDNNNDWAIVLGWQDGYEEDKNDDCNLQPRRKLHMHLSRDDGRQKQQEERQNAGERTLRLTGKQRTNQHRHHNQTHHRISDDCQPALALPVVAPMLFCLFFHITSLIMVLS